MRTLDEVRADRDEQHAIIMAARVRLGELDMERMEIEAAENAQPDHPWLGKKVQRVIQQRLRQSAWSRQPARYRELKQTGIVKRQPAARSHHKGYSPKPGEIFVESVSGATAYRFDPDRNEWSLA